MDRFYFVLINSIFFLAGARVFIHNLRVNLQSVYNLWVPLEYCLDLLADFIFVFSLPYNRQIRLGCTMYKWGSLTLHLSLHEKFSNTELFLVRIFPHSDWIRIQSECGKIRARNNSLFGHFSRSASYSKNLWKKLNHRILMMECCSISGDN